MRSPFNFLPSTWPLEHLGFLLSLFFVSIIFVLPSFALAATPANQSNTASTLLAFKQSISPGPTGFLSGWNNSVSHYCSWPGVLCSHDTLDVVGLLLDSKHLNGSISPQLANLPHLAYVNLSENRLIGSIPMELGKLVALTHLDLSANYLTGTIPVSLANCTRLEYLDVRINNLSGTFPSYLPSFASLVYVDLSTNTPIEGKLPSDFGLLSNLQFFQMDDTHISCQIPTSITNCTNLVWLALSGNQLSGKIPQDWSGVPNLQRIYLDNNGLSGSLPPSLGNCTMLTMLDLYNNYLTGEIPGAYLKLTRLQEVRLFVNSLSGIIPPFVTNWTGLTVFEVAYNNLSGSIPSEIGQLKELELLSFTANPNLAGSIPDSIGNCLRLRILAIAITGVGASLPKSLLNITDLETLLLQGSRFSGTLSEDIGKLTSLLTLNLNSNSLYGQVPKGLGALKNLQGLDISQNRFTGSIPSELAGCTMLAELYLSGNSLSGIIPSSLGQLNGLNDLHLDDNLLYGQIPESFGNFTRLANVTLSHNMLSGSIPSGLANLKSISIQLDLSFNNLSGTIPPTLGSITMIQVINLAVNKFTGDIPRSLGDCIALQVLNLSGNRLDGEIPQTFENLKNLQYLDLSHNNLTGTLPTSLGLLVDLVFLNVSFNQLQGQIPTLGVYRNSSPNSFLKNSGLCGTPLPFTCGSSRSSRNHDKNVVRIATSCAAGGVFLVVIFGVLYWSCGKKCTSLVLICRGLEEDSFDVDHPRIKAWTAKELMDLTKNFDIAYAIGSGSLSVCYRATMEGVNDVKPIAIKKMDLGECNEKEARKSFVNELKTLCRMRHRNLVKVLGYCVDAGVIALILEFMEKGTVDEHLHGGAGRLSWDERLNVAVDVAEALLYLHHEYGQPVIHCDLKPKNILLGSDMVAKVADFGIARLLDGNQTAHQTVSTFRGTVGYAAPECASGLRVSTSADVYSYGVLLAELVTGLRPTSERLEEEGGASLTRWARGAYESGRTKEVVDMELQKGTEIGRVLKEAEQLLRIAFECSQEGAGQRPSMMVVREMVVRVKEQKLAADNARPPPPLPLDQLLQAQDFPHIELSSAPPTNV